MENILLCFNFTLEVALFPDSELLDGQTCLDIAVICTLAMGWGKTVPHCTVPRHAKTQRWSSALHVTVHHINTALPAHLSLPPLLLSLFLPFSISLPFSFSPPFSYTHTYCVETHSLSQKCNWMHTVLPCSSAETPHIHLKQLTVTPVKTPRVAHTDFIEITKRKPQAEPTLHNRDTSCISLRHSLPVCSDIILTILYSL